MKTVLVTGSEGFIGSAICDELLDHGYFVFGIDNFSKYGVITRKHRNDRNFKLIIDDIESIEGDGSNTLAPNSSTCVKPKEKKKRNDRINIISQGKIVFFISSSSFRII